MADLTTGHAERVARARRDHYAATLGWKSWDQIPPEHRAVSVEDTAGWLSAIERAGLAVVELPEPSKVTDTGGLATARFGPIRATSWPAGADRYVSHSELPAAFDADEADTVAAQLLAAARWLRQRGGDGR